MHVIEIVLTIGAAPATMSHVGRSMNPGHLSRAKTPFKTKILIF